MSRTTNAIFPGSFDPLTYGHIDIISRSLQIFDNLTVAVLLNSRKDCLFSVEERLSLIRDEFRGYGDRVSVESFSGLLVDFARERDARVIVRGLRAITDYDFEAQMALMNRALADDIETFFLMTRAKYSYVSSSMAREVVSLGGSVSSLVPPGVERALEKKMSNRGSDTDNH